MQESWSLVEKGQKLWVEIPRTSLVPFPLSLIPGTPPESREWRTQRLQERNEHSVSPQFPIHAHQLTELSKFPVCYHVTHCHGTLKRREKTSPLQSYQSKLNHFTVQMWTNTNTLDIYVIISKKESPHLIVVLFFKLKCLLQSTLQVPLLWIGTFPLLPLQSWHLHHRIKDLPLCRLPLRIQTMPTTVIVMMAVFPRPFRHLLCLPLDQGQFLRLLLKSCHRLITATTMYLI